MEAEFRCCFKNVLAKLYLISFFYVFVITFHSERVNIFIVDILHGYRLTLNLILILK